MTDQAPNPPNSPKTLIIGNAYRLASGTIIKPVKDLSGPNAETYKAHRWLKASHAWTKGSAVYYNFTGAVGVGDPPLPHQLAGTSLQSAPPEQAILKMLKGWEYLFKNRAVSVKNVIDSANRTPKWKDVIRTVIGPVQGMRLVWWLRKNAGVVIDGKTIVRDAETQTKTLWRLVNMETNNG